MAARLLGLTTLPVLLLAGRVIYTGSLTHTYIVWNLLLAWLPLAFAYLALRPRTTLRPLRLAFGLAWLLFLPNAPYLVTDMIHLPYGGGIPILYDVVLLFSAALCGLVLGLVSLRWMQTAVAGRLGAWPGRLFGLTALGMAGFGIYLGRYLRWSSWDVVLKPAALARDIWLHVIHPVQHWQAWALALLFAALLTFAYGLLTTLGETTYPPTGL
jgi:uncharacterized membrane protein